MPAAETGTPGTHRARHGRDEEVLQAAIDVFHRKGYATASIKDVASGVGVLKGSLYHYIDSKEDLLARILVGSDQQAFAIMDDISALEVSSTERLRAFAHAWSLWCLENVERASLYFNEWRYLTGERLESLIERRHRYERYVVALIEAVKQDGGTPANLDVRYAAFFVLSAINLLPSWYKRDGADAPGHIAEVWADMVLATVCR
jgi:TetR/AcrR family transcriptional regulator, cholesterol catabolism regulator